MVAELGFGRSEPQFEPPIPRRSFALPCAARSPRVPGVRPETYISRVKSQCEALAKAGLWSHPPLTNPGAWLQNFDDEADRVVAAIVLHKMVLFSEQAVGHLLRRAFCELLRLVASGKRSTKERQACVEAFLMNATFCPIEGENPNVTDSGGAVCRRLRKTVGLSEASFATPAAAVLRARAGSHVVFVDDFVGSGSQLATTWQRDYQEGDPKSFAGVRSKVRFDAYLLCLVTTPTAIQVATQRAIRAAAAHRLTGKDSIQHLEATPDLPIREDLGSQIGGFLRRQVPHLNLPSYMNVGDYPVYGFKGLGLLLGFFDSVPDSTLPVVWGNGLSDTWTPLQGQL